jgi:Domain of unknown function (DUF4167)
MRSGPDQQSRGRFNPNRPTQQHRVPQNNRLLDSHGPAERIRGSASQITERYLTLAREAERIDDRVSSQNYYQHAEHYFRINKLDHDGNSAAESPPSNRATGEPTPVPTERSEVEGGCAQP